MCCCCEKRTGHLVVAWLTLVYCTAAFIFAVVQASIFSGYVSEGHVWAGFITAGHILAGYVVASVFCIIGIGFSVLDIYGIHKNNRLFMIPFFVWMVIAAILWDIGTVILIIMVIVKAFQSQFNDYVEKPTYRLYATVIVICLLTFILYSYFCHVIRQHMKEVKALEVQPVVRRDVPMKSRRESWVMY